MDGFVHNIGLFEKLFYFGAHKLLLLIVSSLVLVGLSKPLSTENEQAITGSTFNIEFSTFSPAFAAFEDEFLFDDSEPSTSLIAGRKNQVFVPTAKNSKTLPLDIKPSQAVIEKIIHFDGSVAISKISNFYKSQALKPNKVAPIKSETKQLIANQELSYGPLVAMVNKPVSQGGSPQVYGSRSTPQPSNLDSQDHSELHEHSHKAPNPSPIPDSFKVLGSIQLKGGLAFLGSMEVSWVVGDYELQRGSINTPDATFEIEVSDLVGEVIISLYDNKDDLIGEGVYDLSQGKILNNKIEANIDILPINWDLAGKVIDANSFGVTKPQTVKGINVELYAFNEATQSNDLGQFSFYNWKKSNSRTLAIASKKGYKDSIFMLDSKKESTVVMFRNEYMDSFFSFIRDQGIYDVQDLGTVYGSILGPNAQGYNVKLEKAHPIYFSNAGFAQANAKATNSNGLFAFVGLTDGDYELSIERDGEIIDQQIVIVEQGKVSPVLVDLNKIKKHLQFFNPMNPEQKIESVEISFFDGIHTQALDKHNSKATTLSNNNTPALVDYAGTEITRTFVSSSRGLQRLPLLLDKSLMNLAESNNLTLSNGLVMGFIESPEPYVVSMKEDPQSKVIYFNKLGKKINPHEEIAYGFILGDFHKGLSSLLIQEEKSGILLMTDIIYSDHKTISVVNSIIKPIN